MGSFPDAELGIVIAAGINNKSSECLARDEITKELAEANIKARKFIDKDTLSECSAVSVWREAFQKFKKKKGNRSSIEALLSRVQKGNEVGPINPLVDIYNTMSLTYGLPCGGEDLDNIAGTMRLTLSENGGEEFIAIWRYRERPHSARRALLSLTIKAPYEMLELARRHAHNAHGRFYLCFSNI